MSRWTWFRKVYYAQALMTRARLQILICCPERGNNVNLIKTRRIMKKIFFPIVMMASLLVAGCVKENLVEPDVPQSGVTVLTANVDAATRTVLQDDEKVLWTNGDKINVNGVESAALELEEAAASAQFTFEGLLESPYKAVFPSSIYKDATTVTLPAYQTYKEGSFSESASPMAAVSSTASLEFSHLCAVIKLTVNMSDGSEHDNIEYVDFYGKNNEQVSGDFTIDFDALSLSGASTADADRKIRYKVSKTLGEEPFVMYLVVPAQEYANGYTIRLVDDKGHFMEQSKKSDETLVTGKIYDMPAFDFVPTGTDLDVEIATAQDLIDFATAYNNREYADEDLLVVSLSQDIVFDETTSAAYAATGGIGTAEQDAEGNTNYFNGVFDGNGKAIKGYVANIPLFAYTGSNGYIRNLLIDETSAFTFDASKLDYMSAIVGYHRGEIKNVTVASDITVADAAVAADKYIGSICGRIVVGSVEGASYTGSISVPAGFSVTGKKAYVGGIAGRISNADGVIEDTDFKGTLNFAGHVASTDKSNPFLMLGGIVGDNAGTISGCEVFGDKTMTVTMGTYTYDTPTLANCSTLAYFTAEGGVAGMNTGKVLSCVNRANFVNFVLRTGTDGTAADANSRYLYDGGIAGYNKGEISGCNNYGFIFNRSTPRLQKLGGIVGRNEGTVKDCVNETTGTISVGTAGSDSYSARLPYIGGVIGENTSANISNVQNKAKLTISRTENSANAEVRIGGVIGSTTAAIDGTSSKNISNSGDVVVESNNSNVTLGFFEGGVVGWTSASVKNSKNTGDVSHKHSAILQNLYLSGVVGAVVSTKDVEISGCRNEGEVYINMTVANSDDINNHVGGVLAYSVSNVAISSCENTGYVHGGNSTKQNGRTLYIGGVAGYLKGKSSISSCANTGNVYNDHFNNSQAKDLSAYTGGIVAFAEGTEENIITVTDCTANRTDDSKCNSRRGYFGGIAGYAEYTNISGSTCSTDFDCSAYYIGGIAAWLVNSTVSNCDWTGTSIASSQIQVGGGIVGIIDTGSTVDGCKSYCTTVTKGGLIAGKSVAGSTIKNCHYKAGLSLGICSDTNFTGENNTADL